MSVFSQKLKELVKESGMMQKEVAEQIGISPSNLSFYINGREPNYDILCNIANYFGVTIDYLLGNSPYKHYYDELLALKRREELRKQELESLINEKIENDMTKIKDMVDDLSGLLNTLAITEDQSLYEFNNITNLMIDMLYLLFENKAIVDGVQEFQNKSNELKKAERVIDVSEIVSIYQILREIKSKISEMIINAIYYVLQNDLYNKNEKHSLIQILADSGSNHFWDCNVPRIFREDPFTSTEKGGKIFKKL